MSFIDVATGSPDHFEREVIEAFGHMNIHGEGTYCVLAGAAYLQQVLKRLSMNTRLTSADHVKQVGTASLVIQTSHGRVYCQAVNDRYTESWPLPWVVGGDRKRLMGSHTEEAMKGVITADITALAALYIPDHVAVLPPDYVVRCNEQWPGITTTSSGGPKTLTGLPIIVKPGTPSATQKVVDVAIRPGRCSPVQQFCVDYPFKAPNRVSNYLEPRAGKPVPPPVVSEPQPAGPKEKTLAEVMGDRRKQSRWGS